MPRHKTGGAVYKLVQKGKKKKKIWFARIQFFDDFGKRKQRHRKPDYNSETSARAKAREMLAELDENPKSFDAPEMTFDDLADFYKETYLVDPEYRDGRKVAGLRSKYDCENRLKPLREFFGKKATNNNTQRSAALSNSASKNSDHRRPKYEGDRQGRQAAGTTSLYCNCSPGTLDYASRLGCRIGKQLDNTEPISARGAAYETGRGESEGKNNKP